MALGFWNRSSSRMKRVMTILACFFFAILITCAGVLTPLSAADSNALNNELNDLRASLKRMSIWESAASIFENNFVICLIIFIPVAGPLFGSYALYNSGAAIAAESNSTESNPMHWSAIAVFFSSFILPHALLEFIAYSTALASSLWLTWRIVKRRGREEITRTGKFVLICAGLLLLAAFVEAYLLAALT
jgi:uncharacterized membrane protein SpoIIM required for sporulation